MAEKYSICHEQMRDFFKKRKAMAGQQIIHADTTAQLFLHLRQTTMKLLSSSHCSSFVSTAVIITTLFVSVLSFSSVMASSTVVVDTVKKGNGPAVTKDHKCT